MNNTYGITQSISQKQVLSMFQQQSLQVLSMDIMSVCVLLKDEQESNPMLDVPPDIFERAAIPFQNQYYLEDIEYELSAACDPVSQKDLLREQVDTKMQAGELGAAIDAVISDIDESTGFLCHSAEYISGRLSERVSAFLPEALHYVRSLDPGGAGVYDVKAFLLWQLEQQGADTPLLKSLISNCLPQISSGHLQEVARLNGVKNRDIEAARQIIGSLKPYPFWGIGQASPQYIVPDALITAECGQISVVLNNEWFSSVTINPDYARYMQDTDDEDLKAYLQDKLNHANDICARIAQRSKTLESVCRYIADIQKEHFLNGAPLNNLSASDIARKLGVSSSTVSRCLHNKYVQTALGTFPLCAFVTSAASRRAGLEKKLSGPEAALKKIILCESAASPFSDEAIAKRMEDMGFAISRRTVAKYRKKLNIPSTRSRGE